MQVVDIMTANPHVVLPDDSVVNAAIAMRDLDVGVVPVVADRGTMRPIGVLTDRDIATRHVAAAHHHDCAARDAMTGGCLAVVRDTDDVGAALRAMRNAAVHRVLVTNSQGRLVGIVGTADLLRAAEDISHERVTSLMEALAEPAVLER